MQDLRGKRALVTGGGTGIGAAISAALAARGVAVAVHHHAGKEAAESLVRDIMAGGGTAHAIGADLTADGAPAELVSQAARLLGGLDILVNNAGGMVARRLLADVDDDFIDAVFDLNARTVIHCCRAALPHFAAAGRGNIINVTSISARTGGSPGSSIYSAAKGFVTTFTHSLARELAPARIRVNGISPGTIATDFHVRHSTPEKLEATRRAIPMERLGSASDCAGAALYLASEDLSGYVTGQVIEVNGGQLIA